MISQSIEKIDQVSMELAGVDLDEVYDPNRRRVLVIEDDLDTVILLKNILRVAGFNVSSATGGREALKKCKDLEPDLVLLDLIMPELDGWETLRYVRQISSVPVIILSARSSKDEIVNGLKSGVDDYLTKPFHNAELVERVKVVLKRAKKDQIINRLVFPEIDLTIDMVTQEVNLENHRIELTGKEFAVLAALAKNAPSLTPYEKIARDVWGEDNLRVRKRTKYLVYLLRRKMEISGFKKPLIANVDRLGYRLQAGN